MRYFKHTMIFGALLVGASTASQAAPAGPTTTGGTFTRTPKENQKAPTPKAPNTFGQPESIEQWLRETHLKTEARLYTTYQAYSGSHSPLGDRHATSLGGFADAHTAPIYGFSADLGVYTGQSLGLNPDKREDQFVYLPSTDETSLAQAYLQYANRGLRVRAGRQFIQTPFASVPIDRQVVPNSFEGVSLAYTLPNTPITLNALRMFRFKPYNKDDFERGDAGFRPSQDVNPYATLPSVNSDGFLALGADYKKDGRQLRGWYYDFYNRLRLGYVEADSPLPFKLGSLTPIAGVQYVHEWNTGSQRAPYGHVDADVYGVKLGLAGKRNTVLVDWQYNPTHEGHFQGGGYVAPYSYTEYNDTPLFARQIIASAATVAQPQSAINIKDILHLGAFDLIGGYKFIHSYKGDAYNHPRVGGHGYGAFAVINYHVTKNFTIQNIDAFHKTKASGPLGTVSTERLALRYSFDVN